MRRAFRIVLLAVGIVLPACGSGGIDNSGAVGGATGGESSGGAATGGAPSGGAATGGAFLCDPGLTRVCVGPGACRGGQKCDLGGTWTDCDCGQGGSPATGGATNSSGGASSGGAETGGTPVFWTGGVSNPSGGRNYASGGNATGGAVLIPVGGAPTGGRSSAGMSSGGTASGVLSVDGGYVTAGLVHGYAWTMSGPPSSASTIAPADFSSVSGATQLCVTGSVAPDASYGGYGILGIYLNQDSSGTNPPVNTYTPTGTGVVVNVTNAGGSTLRLQIQAPGGDTDAAKRWCAGLTAFGTPVTIPWSAFNTKCWDNSGTSYSKGTPLESLVLLVPGGNSTAVPFDFCLNGLSI